MYFVIFFDRWLNGKKSAHSQLESEMYPHMDHYSLQSRHRQEQWEEALKGILLPFWILLLLLVQMLSWKHTQDFCPKTCFMFLFNLVDKLIPIFNYIFFPTDLIKWKAISDARFKS